MNQIAPPSLSRGGAQPPDDLDGLLRAFFRAEMPKKWTAPAPPSVRLAPPPVRKTPKGWPVLRTRLALAASVLILAAVALFQAGAFQGGNAIPEKKGPEIIGPRAGTGAPPPTEFKVKESLIQEPGGTTIKIDVMDLPPVSPK